MDGPAARYKTTNVRAASMYQASEVERLLGPSWRPLGVKTSKGHLGTQKLSLNLNVGFITRCNTSLEATDAALANDHIYHGALGI